MNRFFGAVVVSALAIGAAHAQQGQGGWRGGGGMFRMADADGDGVVTRAEYQAAVDARFARMDANGDGVLASDERPGPGRHGMRGGDGAPPAPMAPAGSAATSSPPPPAEGSMTRDQFRAQSMRRFDAADTNHDGRIDAAEMQAMMTQLRGGPGGMAPPAPAAGAPQ